MIMTSFLLSGEFSDFQDLFLERFHRIRHVAAGETIIAMSDDRSKNCYYVLEGVAAYIIMHEKGGAKTSSLRGPGTIFPLYYTHESTHMERVLDVVAQTDMTLIDIPKPELMQLMVQDPQIAIAMCDAWGKYATLLLYDVSSQLFDSASVRVCSFLYIQFLTYGPHLKTSHEKIGEATGVTRATVTRILSDLVKNEIIATNRNKLTILDVDHLLEYCSYLTSPEIAESDNY